MARSKFMWGSLLFGAGALLLTGCPEPDPGVPTSTSSSSSTSSTSSSSSTTSTSVPPGGGATVSRLSAGGASAAVISRNGRYVAFTSTATSPGVDGNGGAPDVFLYDWQTASTTRVSGGNAASTDPSVSDTGAVVFRSAATDLAGAPANAGRANVYYWTSGGGMVRVTDSGLDVAAPLVSADGSTVVFGGPEALVTGASSRMEALRWQPAAPLVITALAEAGGEGASPVAVSADGGLVLLAEPGRLSLSESPGIAATVVAAAPASPPAPKVTTFSVAPHAIAADGDVVFAEVTYSFDGSGNVMSFESGVLKRWDRQGATVSTIAAPGAAAGPVVSDDGVRVIVADRDGVSVDQDDAPAFVPGAIRAVDVGGSTTTAVGTADSSFGTVSADGRRVAFVSTSTALALPDPNGAGADVYLWNRGT